MSRVTVEIEGWSALDRGFAEIQERASDARPVWDDVARAITEDQGVWFTTQGEGSWKPLTKRYAAWKAKSRYAGGPPGVLTGGLRDSVVSEGGTKYSVRKWDADELEVGTKNPVARLQRWAGRPPLGKVLPGEQEHYLELLHRWVLFGEQQ